MGNSDFTRMCSTEDCLAFGVRWTRSEVNMEGLMPISIKHRYKNMAVTQQSEVGSIGPEAMLFSKAFYTAIDTVPEVL